MCTVGKLFWSVDNLLNPSKCSGNYELFGSINEQSQQLILNRLTPYHVERPSLSTISICKLHKVIFALSNCACNLTPYYPVLVNREASQPQASNVCHQRL